MPTTAPQLPKPAASCGTPPPYERRRPETTTLYQIIQDHSETFFAHVEQETGTGLPQFVKAEFDAFLECGIRAKVEHPFRVIKHLWGHGKLRYKGLAKNAAQFTRLCALSNLFFCRCELLAAD